MEPIDEITSCWARGREKDSTLEPLKDDSLRKLVKARLNKERTVIFSYFWASLVWQIMVYAGACHFFVRFWGETGMMLLSLGTGLLFIPFTITFMRKYKSIAISGSVTEDISSSIRFQHEKLSEFFRFKKGFDWVVNPVIAIAIVVIIFRIYVPEGIAGHLVGAAITCMFVLAPFILATWYENRKRFTEPLEKLERILSELKAEGGT